MNVKNSIKQEFIESMGYRIQNNCIEFEKIVNTELRPFQHSDKEVILIEMPLCCITHSIDVDIFLAIYKRTIKHITVRKGKRLQAMLKHAQKSIKGDKRGNGHAPFIIQWLKDGVEF